VKKPRGAIINLVFLSVKKQWSSRQRVRDRVIGDDREGGSTQITTTNGAFTTPDWQVTTSLATLPRSMKAERRHELQTNSLAQALQNFPQFMQQYGTKIIIAIVLIVLLARNHAGAAAFVGAGGDGGDPPA